MIKAIANDKHWFFHSTPVQEPTRTQTGLGTGPRSGPVGLPAPTEIRPIILQKHNFVARDVPHLLSYKTSNVNV